MERVCLVLAVLGTAVGGCDVGDEEALSEASLPLAAADGGRWLALGGDLAPDPAAYLSRPSLAVAATRPLVAFSSLDTTSWRDTTTVLRWAAAGWLELGGFDGGGPAIAADEQHRPLVCFGSGPFVTRWNGSSWLDLGGDISTETGYRGARYLVEGCEGIVTGDGGEPTVAWSADVGAKANRVFVARWSRRDGRWIGLGVSPFGEDGVDPRATAAAIALDRRDRLVVATFTPGGSYGGGDTTRAFRREGAAWTRLGTDMPGTSEPTIAIDGDRTYLACGVAGSSLPPAVTVMQWRGHAWRAVAPALVGEGPALAFSSSGRLVLAYRASEGAAGDWSALRVVRLAHGQWHAAGDDLADLTTTSARQAIAVDALGRPLVAWSQVDDSTGTGALFVRRFSEALP